jgi:indolepyruvate ferredoxin oxidoreductase
MEIRGYGPVKEAAIHKVKAEVERLMAQLAASPEMRKTPELAASRFDPQSPSPLNSTPPPARS